MKRSFEFIVLGLGGIGSAALYWLARRAGDEVLGIEQFRLGHDQGSSQDHSRIIRLAYDEAFYTALTPHAFIHFQEVEAESGVQLIHRTGSLIFGSDEVSVENPVRAYILAMHQVGIPFAILDPREAMYRYPQFRFVDGDLILYSAHDGFVDARKSNAVHIALARQRGAEIFENLPVQRLRLASNGVELETREGVFRAKQLVIAAGAWTNKLLEGLGRRLPLTVTEEQVTYFATPNLADFSPRRFPVWIYHGEECFYGFPVYGEAATKAGQDIGGDVVTADTRKFAPNPRPYEALVNFLEWRIPDFLGPLLYTKPCLYTLPPDRHFVLDRLPEAPHISVFVGAGHGFKFAGLFGRILSDLAVDGHSVFPIEPFSITRPALTDPDFEPAFRTFG